MSGSSFVLSVGIPLEVSVEGHALSREEFYAWLWDEFTDRGLLGVHEGTLLSEQAAETGLETTAWTLDSGEAPRERDWMGQQARSEAELYFGSRAEADAAAADLSALPELEVGAVREQKDEDWDARWKASFLAKPEGVVVPPFWRILPPWASEQEAKLQRNERVIRINPGAGFGTGTHETTQLCLGAIGETSQAKPFWGRKVLDFGSGSGILSIGAALLGGEVIGVEIDPLAIDNAVENARLNEVESRVKFSKTLDSAAGTYPLVIANILKPVLLEFAAELVSRLEPGGTVILSGLIEGDVAEVSARYASLLGRPPQKRELGEWRALKF